jgi:hypothetical protein
MSTIEADGHDAPEPKMTSAVDTTRPVAAFGTPLQDLVGPARVAEAYWQVMSELQGTGLTPDHLTGMKSTFIDQLGDPKRAGRVMAEALDPIVWDWPRWHPFAKRRGYNTVQQVIQTTNAMGLHAMLQGSTKAELMALGASLELALPRSHGNVEMVQALMALPIERFDSWVKQTRQRLTEKQLLKTHREMGQFIACRVGQLALSADQYARYCDPDYMRLHPYWRFICPDDWLSTAPKKCRDLDQKVLPAAEAMKIFPTIPCARVDCDCRVTTQGRA